MFGMRSLKREVFATLACASVLLLCTAVSQAGEKSGTFAYSVDQFELVGNLPVYGFDGFADGDVLPWVIEEPTVEEAGGFLTLSTPGVFFGPYQIGGVWFQSERSSVRTDNDPRFNVVDGQGDFTATSKWAGAAAVEGTFYGMALWSRRGGTSYHTDLSMSNVEARIANALGIPPGLAIILSSDNTGVYEFQGFSISASDITGPVFLRLSFDDAANLISGSFSLDGGDSYLAPFSSVSSNLTSANQMEWFLEAERWKVVESLTCRSGMVDTATSAVPYPVLTVNGSEGDAHRVVTAGVGEAVSVFMDVSPSGPNPAKFALYVWLGEPTDGTVTPQPAQLGSMCFPTPLAGTTPQPKKIWNNIGRFEDLGYPDYPSSQAPSTVFSKGSGFADPLTATFQGFIMDSGSAANKPASITNAVVLKVVE